MAGVEIISDTPIEEEGIAPIEPEVIPSSEPEPVISIVIDLIQTGEDSHDIRVQAPMNKRLILLGMLDEAKRLIQAQPTK